MINTVFYIMAIAVLAGAVSGLLMEFGVVAAINKILSPLMKPLYGLPGASVVGVVTTYLSDNPAILTLAGDDNFKRYFKKYQLPALTNIGTAFGMGMIITTFMIGIKTPSGGSFVTAAPDRQPGSHYRQRHQCASDASEDEKNSMGQKLPPRQKISAAVSPSTSASSESAA